MLDIPTIMSLAVDSAFPEATLAAFCIRQPPWGSAFLQNRTNAMNRLFGLLLSSPIPCLSAFTILLVLGLPAEGTAQQLQYTVSFPQARGHYAHVELKVSDPPESLVLMMPTWTPGSYLIREYARFIDSEAAVNAKGESISSTKISKNRWQLDCGETESVTFSYRLYCHELSVRTNWIDDELAVLNGAATFVVPADQLDAPLSVQLELPDHWPRSVSALQEDDEKPQRYLATTFHELVDSPILAGNCHIHPFEVGGVPHALVNLGEDDLWDAQKSVSDLKKIVKAHQEFWEVVPYDHYLFLNVIRGGGGGLEHDNCTMIMGNRYTCRSDRSYKSWLTLASHEFFHTWNVRRLRPQILTEYDYENEVYLRQLWIAEGITSYYENILAARAGVLSEKEILEGMGREIRGVELTPGNTQQSLSDSSFDTWIKFYRPHENSRNVTISYYSRGAVAAFLLDMEIRRLTDNQKSLDDVMVHLFQNHVPGGYSSEDFRRVCSDMAGSDLSSWFDQYIDNPGSLDYGPALDFLGLKFNDVKPKEPRPELGASLSGGGGQVTVRSVQLGSTAYKAGLDMGDEIIAINNRRVTDSSLSRELEGRAPGDLLEVLIARRGELKTLPVQLQAAEYRQFKISEIKDADEAKKQRRTLWLTGEAEAGNQEEAKTETAESDEVENEPEASNS